MLFAVLIVASYLIGSIPFGYLAGRWYGIDLFREGSGNIGATNVGRVLGRRTGLLVFVLDFLKGALPVAGVEPVARALDSTATDPFGLPGILGVGAAAATFLGHLFPVTLGFRGGKGVATGAGAVAVLVPLPFAIALLIWILVVLTTRTVSLGSVVAAGALVAARVWGVANAFGPPHVAVTTFCLFGAGLVLVKHRSNIRRLLAGTENRLGDSSMRHSLIRVVHVLAVGFWFGGAGFFNFAAAPSIFRSFEDVVRSSPSDRTANLRIIPPDVPADQLAAAEKNLASALAGAAVGPIFPLYFAAQVGCGLVALTTAWTWRNADNRRRVHRHRVGVLAVAWVTVLVGSALSNTVSELRAKRYDPNPEVAKAAADSFRTLHFYSLGLSVVTVGLAGVALGMTAFLPREANGTVNPPAPAA